MTFKEIKKILKEKNVNIAYEDKNVIYIRSCSIGDNYYDYGEEEPPLKVDEEFEFLFNDDRIEILSCCDCCGCGSW